MSECTPTRASNGRCDPWCESPRRRRPRIGRIGRWLAGLLLVAALPVVGEVNPYLVDTGPLRVRDQFLLGLGFLAFDPAAAKVLEEGEWQVDLIETATNHFARSDSVGVVLEERDQRGRLTLEELRAVEPTNGDRGVFFVDGELYRTALAVRRGVGKGVQLDLVLPLLSFQGGVVDSLIEEFHTAFGFDQEGRLGTSRNSFQVYSRSQGGELLVEDVSDLALGDLVLGARFRLREPNGRQLGVALEAQIKLPTGGREPIATSGSVDVGAQLLATRYYSRSCLHAAVGLLALGPSDRLAIDSQLLLSGMAALEHAIGGSMSGLLQVTLSQSPFGDLQLSDLNRTSLQVTVGLKRVVGRGALFVGLTENFGSFNNTPDVGFHVGLTRSFGERQARP